jgi:cytochrome c oxidase assembly protein subunit 15
VYYWVKAKKINHSSLFNQYKNWPLILIIVQIILGIASVLVSPHIKIGSFGMFEWLALFHQLIGMCLLLSFIAVNYLIKFK